MKRAFFLVVLLSVGIVVAVVSCRTTRPSKVVDAGLRPGPLTPEGRWIPPDALALVIRNRAGEACKPADVENLVRASGLRVQQLAPPRVALPPALRAYCVIDRSAPPQQQQRARARGFTVEEQERLRGLVPKDYEASFDYPVLMPAASALETLPPLELRQTFLERAGGADPQNSTWPDEVTPTRLAVIDTVAGTGANWPLANINSDPHGAPLARMIQELTCPGGAPGAACLAELVGYSALPTTLATGQRVGMLHQLAAAISQAVADANGKNLVLNLSLGWVPVEALGGDDLEDMPTATKAVYEALRYAACHKAAVFAAAGNDLGAPGGAFDDGAVYPAAWMGKTGFECSTYDGAGTFEGTVVHAVGGVTAKGYRMGLTRDQSLPNLVAIGVKGAAGKVIQDPPPIDKVTAPMSGTSVATAVVSAAAAARWAFQTSLNSEDLVAQMKGSASPIAETVADFQYDSNKIARMKVCEQVNAACASAGCGGGTFTCRTETNPGPSPATLAAIKAALPNPTAPALAGMSCPGGVTVLGVSGSTRCMNALIVSIDETPWVHTQPGEEPCIRCALEIVGANTRFYGAVTAALLPGGEAWLEIQSTSSTTLVDLGGLAAHLGVAAQLQDQGVVIDGLPGSPSTIRRARLIGGVGPSPALASTAGEVQVLP